VGSFEEGEHFLFFASGDDAEVKFLEVVGDDVLEESIFAGDLQVFSEMFVDEILLGLEDVDKLFELLYLHGIVDILKLNKFQYFLIDYFEDEGDDAEHPIDQDNYLLFLRY